VSQWVSQQQQQQQLSGVPLMAYRQPDPGSSTMTWQLLNSAALCSSSSSSDAASAAVLHPLGAQLRFPAALATLSIEVRDKVFSPLA
jgi:hypothetical protein